MLKFSGQSRSSEVVSTNKAWQLHHDDMNGQHKTCTCFTNHFIQFTWGSIDGKTASIQSLNFNQPVNETGYVSLSCWFVDPQANVVPGIPETAICVQDIAALYILQFAIVIALCCALHRSASRVIHRSEWFRQFFIFSSKTLSAVESIFQVPTCRRNYQRNTSRAMSTRYKAVIITSHRIDWASRRPLVITMYNQANGNPEAQFHVQPGAPSQQVNATASLRTWSTARTWLSCFQQTKH